MSVSVSLNYLYRYLTFFAIDVLYAVLLTIQPPIEYFLRKKMCAHYILS